MSVRNNPVRIMDCHASFFQHRDGRSVKLLTAESSLVKCHWWGETAGKEYYQLSIDGLKNRKFGTAVSARQVISFDHTRALPQCFMNKLSMVHGVMVFSKIIAFLHPKSKEVRSF